MSFNIYLLLYKT